MKKLLANRRVLSLKGEGVLPFLQGLVTQDTQLLRVKEAAIACLFLNARGRIISDALIVKSPSCYFLDLPGIRLDSVADLLTRHKLRLPIQIEKSDNLSVFFTSEEFSNNYSFEDPRDASLPRRCIAPGEIMTTCNENIQYKRQRLLAGVVEAQDVPPDSIPIFYNFDLFNCISFNKGCYTGQELITRTIRRGVVRRRAVAVKTSDGSPIREGAKIFIEGSKEIGAVIVCEADVGLAVLQLDAPQGLNERSAFATSLNAIQNLSIDGVTATVVVPKYL